MQLFGKERKKQKICKKKRKITCVVWNFLSKEKIRKIKTSTNKNYLVKSIHNYSLKYVSGKP